MQIESDELKRFYSPQNTGPNNMHVFHTISFPLKERLFLNLLRSEPLIWDILLRVQVVGQQVLSIIYPQCVKIT